jgi:hypothetical protein
MPRRFTTLARAQPSGCASRPAAFGRVWPRGPRLPAGRTPRPDARCTPPGLSSDICPLSFELLPWPGGHSAGAPPDPIPNSAVKPRRAQGTAVLTVGERVVARPSQQFQVQKNRAQRAPRKEQRSPARSPRPWPRPRRARRHLHEAHASRPSTTRFPNRSPLPSVISPLISRGVEQPGSSSGS